MTKTTSFLLALICVLSAVLLYQLRPLISTSEPLQSASEQSLTSQRTRSHHGNLYALFKQKKLSEFSSEELLLLLETQDAQLLTNLAGKFSMAYNKSPESTVALLEQLAQDAMAQGLAGSYLQLTAQVKNAQELNQIEYNVVETWLLNDPTACLGDAYKAQQQGELSHRLSLLCAVYMQNEALQIEDLLSWGDGLAKDRGLLAQKLTVHLAEDSRDVIQEYFQRNIDQSQVQASLIPLLLQSPKERARSQMEWLATVDLSQCKFTPEVVGALFSGIAKKDPQLLVDTLNDTDYLETFLTDDQRESNLADFHYQELYDRVLYHYIHNIVKYEFENANLAVDHIINPHVRKAAEEQIASVRPLFEQQQRLNSHIGALEQ